MEPQNEASERVDQQAKRLTIIMLVWLGILVLLCLAVDTVLGFVLIHVIQHPSEYRVFSWTDPYLLVGIGVTMLFGIYFATMFVAALRVTTKFEKRLDRIVRVESYLEKLQEQHPELVALKSVLELVNEENDEASSNRSFWMSFWQNLFFLALGFAFSFVLSKLGWLR